jgi:hypothetical protein
MTTCPECGGIGRHRIDCPAGRCVDCERFPATLGGRCYPCWVAMRRERQRAVAERLERLTPRDDDF